MEEEECVFAEQHQDQERLRGSEGAQRVQVISSLNHKGYQQEVRSVKYSS